MSRKSIPPSHNRRHPSCVQVFHVSWVRGSLPRAGHQRGLVDVTAVALSSAPNGITHVVKSDVPADEADLQGPTWVDSDDWPMDNEPLVTIAEGTTVPIVDSK